VDPSGFRATPRLAFVLALLGLLCFGAAGSASAERPDAADGLLYTISSFSLEYVNPHPDLPSIEDMQATVAPLTYLPAGLVAPREGDAFSSVPIRGVAETRYFGSALLAVEQAIIDAFAARGFGQIIVRPHPEDVELPSGRDLRSPDARVMRFQLLTGVIAGVQTFAQGERFDDVPEDQRVDNPLQARARQGIEDQVGRSVHIDEINDYAEFLGRYPGRLAEASLSSGADPGTTFLDLQITELKPWFAYYTISNTGTEQTTEWRQRFGYINYQLTDNDDTLRIDYITGNFDEVNGVVTSYDIPVWPVSEKWRIKVDGGWAEYDAAEIGVQFRRFEGEQATGGLQSSYNFFQDGPLFVDAVAGVRYDWIKVKGSFPRTNESTDFLFPLAGLRVQRDTYTSSFFAEAFYEYNLASVIGTAKSGQVLAGLDALGRFQAERDIQRLRGSLNWSFYLEPLIYGEDWNDPTTPHTSTLAHEFNVFVTGQTAFNDRLIPQFQQIAGGLYTVRGYPQSIIAGDDVVIGSLEYRFHIPRILPIAKPLVVPGGLGDFRYTRPQVFANPDWDLIFRLFFDVADVNRNKKLEARNGTPLEFDETMRSAGAGLELQLRRNVNIRFDYGIALEGVREGSTQEVRKYHQEYWLSATFLY